MVGRALLLIYLMAGLVLTSCGYHLGSGGSLPPIRVCIPFIEGDKDGLFTEELVRQISSRTSLVYDDQNPQARLVVKIIELRDENVGFRYDRKRSGELRHNIIPVETRLAVCAEVTLFSLCDGSIIFGPAVVGASIDFDHEYYPNRNAVNVFSLGQLTDIDAARDAAIYPLSRELARRIADYLTLCGRSIKSF